jgi:ABC-type branched-subunit amino acid transport system substrate-binding protein
MSILGHASAQMATPPSGRRRRLGRARLGAGALTAIALALASLASAAGANPRGAARRETHVASRSTKKPLVLGAVLDLTGAGAAEGQSEKAGMDFALRTVNETGGVDGRKIEVQTCDTQSTPAGGAQCATQLSRVNSHIVLLLGSLPSTLGAVPHLSGALGITIVPVLFPKRGTDVFQMAVLEKQVVAPFIEAAKKARIQKIGVIYVNEASGTAQLAAVEGEAKASGIAVVSEPMDPSATDVTAELDQLVSQGAQVIFSATIGSADTAVVTSYHTLGLSLPLVMGAEAVTNNFLKSLSFPIPPHLYGISTLAIGPGFSGPIMRAWAKMEVAYKKYAHQPVDSEGGSSQYAVCIAAGALAGTHAGPVGRLKRYLETQTIKCLGANISFDQVPGLNVASGEPRALIQAGPTAKDGWGAVRQGL